MAATIDYLFGYDATAGVMADWMYEQLTQRYVLDAEPHVHDRVQPAGAARHGRTAVVRPVAACGHSRHRKPWTGARCRWKPRATWCLEYGEQTAGKGTSRSAILRLLAVAGTRDPYLSGSAEAQYLLLTTLSDGRPACSHLGRLWTPDRGDRLLATEKKSWKVKRIRNTPRVTLATCTLRGRPTSEAVEATAAILDEAAHENETKTRCAYCHGRR